MIEFNIEESIACLALVWVIISWAKLLIPYMPKMEKFLCLKCATFWLTLAITFNPVTAALAALMAALIDMHLNNTNIRL